MYLVIGIFGFDYFLLVCAYQFDFCFIITISSFTGLNDFAKKDLLVPNLLSGLC